MGFLDLFKSVTYSGGDGSSQAKAVVIHTKSSIKGVTSEYSYLENKFGKKNVDWEIELQMVSSDTFQII